MEPIRNNNSDSNNLLCYNISDPNHSTGLNSTGLNSMDIDGGIPVTNSPVGVSYFSSFQRKSLDNGRFIVLDTLGRGATGKVKMGVDTHSGERVGTDERIASNE